jgi:UPF0716 family protein affecting phage T7 exclusion
MWLHPVLHLILIWAALALLLVTVVMGVSLARKRLRQPKRSRTDGSREFGTEPSVVHYI